MLQKDVRKRQQQGAEESKGKGPGHQTKSAGDRRRSGSSELVESGSNESNKN